MNRLLLIDGHNLLFQMFYGMPARIINKKGVHIQGVVGFIGALFKMIRRLDPTHILLVFDGEVENPRKKISKEYKSNRIDYSLVSESDSPFSQLPLIYKVLESIHIPFIETKVYEADDLIASYVIQNKENFEIIISSFDSDFFRLIDQNVQIFRYRGKSSQMIDASYIKEKLNIQPEQYTLYKALVGDAADAIKGIYGIGPISAGQLISDAVTLDDFINQIDCIKKENLRRKIKENLNQVKLNYSLIEFHFLNELPISIHQLAYTLEENVTSTKVLQEANIW